MSKRKHIREFRSFQSKRKDIETINEAVTQRDDTFIVGGIQVDKKTINAYVKKVKDQTGKDLKSMYSEMQIAEELIRWSASNLDNVDNVPVSALMGGEEEMAEEIDMDDESDIDETGDLDIEESDEDIDTEDDNEEGGSDEDIDTEGDEDFDVDFDEDDFESPEESDDVDFDEDDGDDETPEDDEGIDTEEDEDIDVDEDEDTDLPV